MTRAHAKQHPNPCQVARNLTAESYLQMLDRLDKPERIETIAKLLERPLEDGVRPVLVRAYLDLTDREGTPANPEILTEEAVQ